jgi:hypothetical protein
MARSEETMSLRYDRLLYDGRIVNGREWEVVAAVTLSLREGEILAVAVSGEQSGLRNRRGRTGLQSAGPLNSESMK